MLRVLGSARQFCDGVTRRDLLRVGGLGLAGLSLPQIMQAQEASASSPEIASRTFGRAKNIILIHLYGSPSQIETVDPKPDAPVEIRGELGSIPSSLPGCDVCELLPNFGKVMDRCTVIRSMTHPFPLHGVAYALTGVPAITVAMELSPRDPQHWPYFGSVVEYVDEQTGRNKDRGPLQVPANMYLPFRFSSQRVGEVLRAGPFAAFLGSQYDPVMTDYVGTPTKGIRKTLRDMVFDDNDPYVGTSDDTHFIVPAATSLQPDVTIDRLNRRRSLIDQLDRARRDLQTTAVGEQMDRYREMSYQLLDSDVLRTALDTRKETPQMRELYGPTLFGRSCLAARRLIEAGSRVVSVFWDEYGVAGSGWDTHYNHYERMRVELCPGLDQGFYGLMTDLDQRGLLDETLVVLTSEHGRTPRISTTKQDGTAGRDHWSRVYSTVLAGAGVQRGNVVGASDKHGSDVARRPVSPKDLQATMYHLLGIDHHYLVHDALGRPLPLVEGHVVQEALI